MVEKEKRNLLWNKKTKRPTKMTFLLLILLTLMLFIWGIVNTFSSLHEIKVEINYYESYTGYIEFQGRTESIDDSMGNELTYQVREGYEIMVYVRKTHSSYGTLTVKIYDNGELVVEKSTTQGSSMATKYTVGE
jgi:hypothetical protein